MVGIVASTNFLDYAVFYDPDAFPGDKPSSMADFSDVENFQVKEEFTHGQQVLLKKLWWQIENQMQFQQFYRQTGVLDRAFAKLDTIKDHVVFWSSGAKPLELEVEKL